MIIENDYPVRKESVKLIENKKEEIDVKYISKKYNVEKEKIKNIRESYRERFLSDERKIQSERKDDIKIYFFVSLVFLLGFLVGIIIFKNLINEKGMQEQICSYDFFYEEVEIEHEAFVVSTLYKKSLIILTLWIVGISVIGAPLLLLFCAYRGLTLSIITSSILLKYGLKEGYKFLLSRIFLPTFFTEIVIVFLTVSSIKVMLDVLCERKQLKEEMIRHSVLSVIGAITMFAGIVFECRIILNNFT